MEINVTRYVLGFLFNPQHTSVVLVKKNRPDWQRGFYNGVGGHVEEGISQETLLSKYLLKEITFIDKYDKRFKQRNSIP